MTKKYRLLSKLLALLVIVHSAVGYAAPVQEAYQRIGNYDYIESGIGLRVENSSAACTPSTSNSSGTLSISLPSGQSIDKAFLYWGGSRSSADVNANLQVNGGAATAITATPHTTTFTAGAISLPYYLSVADITSQLQGNGENLTVAVSGIDTDASSTYSTYCAASAYLGIVVVHTTDNAITEPRAVLISHGLEWSRNTSISNTYSNLPPSATVADARATIWAVEGDAGLADSESLFVSGNDQGVIWSQGDNDVGRSFETHQVTPSVAAGSNSLTWTASAGADLVLFPAFFTSWNVNLPIFTKSFSPLAIQTGETSTLTFSIDNTLPGNITQSGILFTDLLPTNIELANSPNLQLNNCAAATVTGPDGISLAGGQGQIEVRDLTVNANQTCSISLDVTSNAPNVGTPNACGGSSDDAWTNGIGNIVESGGLDVQVTDSCLSVSPIVYRCDSTVDVWYANDESGSVNSTEFTQARDFIYQVTDGFYHSVTDGAQGGLIGWAIDAVPTDVVMPITEDFYDQGDSGLATTGTTVDGDGLGIRETYIAKVSASSGTHLARAAQGLADRINGGNGRRTGVPQVAVILTDAPDYQINNVSGNGGGTAWEAAAANLRAAGPDGTRIVLILLAEAADAYDNNAASKATIDTVVGSTGFLIQTSTYAEAADATNNYIDMAIDGICGAATFPVTDDYSDTPADGSTAPNGTSVTAYGDAIHSIDSNLRLGAVIDADSASIASANADGDGADDDGVSTFGTLTDSNQTYSIAATVTNQTGSTARLLAWIDFDGNGRFDYDEVSVRSVPTGAATSIVTLNWSNIPPDIQTGDSFVRLRLTTDTLTNSEPNGAKNDGEVEDYPVTIVSAGVTVSGRVYIDANSSGNEDAGESGISNTVVVLRDTTTNACRSVRTSGSGYYYFSGVSDSDYEIYQAHRDATPVPQNCGVVFANNPTGYQSTTEDTLNVTVTTSDIIGQNFGEVAGTNSSTSGNTGVGIRFEPNQQSEVLPGNVVFYTHVFSTEADGSVRFNTAESGNTVTGWTHTVYQDNNCNGTLDGVEGNTPITGVNIGLPEGGRLCLIDKVYAPSNVPGQDRYNVKTTATFTYLGSTLTPAILEVIDATTAGQTNIPTTQTNPQVGESSLELIKTVENLTQGTAEADTLNQANPNDILRYRIYYRNTGTGPITDLKVNDTVPAYTGFANGSATCDTTPMGMTCTPPTAVTDALSWEFAGSLTGGSKGHVRYDVRVDN